jgi:hypothetical protein
MTYEDIMSEMGMEPLYDLNDDDPDDPDFETQEFDEEDLILSPFPEELA